MKNKVILLMSAILITTSCGVNETQLKQSIKYENGTLSVDIKSPRRHHLICKYFDDVFIDTLFNERIDLNLEYRLKRYVMGAMENVFLEDNRGVINLKRYDFAQAYSLITKGYVPICINLDNRVDTIFTEKIELAPDNSLYAKVISGEICPIEKYYLSKTTHDHIQNWLGEDNFVAAIDMEKMLTRMHPTIYVPTNVDSFPPNIPILKNFAGHKYKIT